MKTKIFIITTIFSLVFVSCKNDNQVKDAEENAPKVEKKEKFSVDLDITAPKDDNFAVYYTEDGTINFTGEKAVWAGVKGQAESQKVVLDLPEEIIPTDIRLDFGLNKEQGDVILEKFKLNFYGKTFEAKGSDFLKYFIANDSVKTEIDQVKGTIKFVKNPKTFTTPFYYPQQAILDEVTKITK
ncbi:hypothetical protein [Flavobacterium sp. GT3R68]|uniref:hypothetical protein n=1 Tax=Flavobacterium sp. GT3R68 TaxID=2594437 RepID=UPI000F875236|nr:hypothetical protein [Flavobacterium sp. GT3R68]RTY95915.1 hypothetical protein EKL32_04515 [Flavobacterium sp. GSN2]TRW93687.1 hypothetical protein FNW07_01905 [Flavobacterium sp. GT3R68]